MCVEMRVTGMSVHVERDENRAGRKAGVAECIHFRPH